MVLAGRVLNNMRSVADVDGTMNEMVAEAGEADGLIRNENEICAPYHPVLRIT